MNKMNPTVKQLWITALRSGEYEQGQGALQGVRGEFCCLGLLCELAVDAGVTERLGRTVGGLMQYGDLDHPASGLLPDAVAEWAGITKSGDLPQAVATPIPSGCGCEGCEGAFDTVSLGALVDLNDDARYTFNQIADVIEEQF